MRLPPTSTIDDVIEAVCQALVTENTRMKKKFSRLFFVSSLTEFRCSLVCAVSIAHARSTTRRGVVVRTVPRQRATDAAPGAHVAACAAPRRIERRRVVGLYDVDARQRCQEVSDGCNCDCGDDDGGDIRYNDSADGIACVWRSTCAAAANASRRADAGVA